MISKKSFINLGLFSVCSIAAQNLQANDQQFLPSFDELKSGVSAGAIQQHTYTKRWSYLETPISNLTPPTPSLLYSYSESSQHPETPTYEENERISKPKKMRKLYNKKTDHRVEDRKRVKYTIGNENVFGKAHYISDPLTINKINTIFDKGLKNVTIEELTLLIKYFSKTEASIKFGCSEKDFTAHYKSLGIKSWQYRKRSALGSNNNNNQ